MSKHTEHSSYREKLIEHLLLGELLKLSWTAGHCDLEVAKPEVDNSGYDVIVEANSVLRHVQIKASFIGAKTTRQKLHVRLADKPSGCVLWIYFNENTLELGPFYYFGGKPGSALPDISNAKVASHTKGNKEGYKAERPNIKVVNKGDFTRYETIEDVYEALFGVSVCSQ